MPIRERLLPDDYFGMQELGYSRAIKEPFKEFVEKTEGVEPLPMDISYLDAYDHIITILLNQADEDKKFGIPWSNGL